jgi:ATP-binding cassette subfamily B protein
LLNGQLEVSAALALVTALACMYWPVIHWMENRRYLRRAKRSALVLFNFLDRNGGVGQDIEAEFLPPMSQQVEFDSVILEDPSSRRRLLNDVSFGFGAGQQVAIVGPDELEKHALVYLIARFLDPHKGEIRMDRRNLRWVTIDSLRAQIGMVLQNNLVFTDTVANNIGCGDRTYPLPRIIEAAKVAHAHQFIQKLPKGYETIIGDLGYSLSVGEQFRIALARAILREPAFFIIEEPTIPLDHDTKALIDDTLARILPGHTVLFLAHRLSTLRNCDQIFVLYNGRIVAAGQHRELLAKNELYRHLQYLEFNEFGNLAPAPVPVVTEQEV